MRAHNLVLAACLLCSPTTATTQVLLEPQPQKANQAVSCKFDKPATRLTDLRDYYTGGKWDLLLAETRSLLETCALKPESGDPDLFSKTPTGALVPNFKRDWYLIVLGTVDRDDQPIAIRYVLHDPLPYPYSTHTVGVPAEPVDDKNSKLIAADTARLVQVFLAANKALTLDAKIQVTETADPVQEQIADAVKAVFDPSIVVPLLKGIVPPSSAAAAPAAATNEVFASVSRIFPPFDRADYKYTDVIRAPAMLDADKSLLLREKFDGLVEAAAKAAEAAAGKPEAPTRQQELELARALSTAAKSYLVKQQDEACSPAKYSDTCWTGLVLALETAAKAFCLKAGGFCKDERDELMVLRFKEVGQAPKTTTTSSSTTLSNIPYQRLSFGTIGAYIAGASASKDRVKVDSGKVVADPIGRAMTAVVLNFHKRYNPKAPRMEPGERWRAFVGAVLTPNFGASVGGGFAVHRNLSFNVGYAALVIPTLREDEQLNAEPANGTTPFKAGAAHIGFIGFGYKFGK